MFNKKRMVVFAIFVLLMFFLTTFAGEPAQNASVVFRDVIFTDGFDNKNISEQKVELGKAAEVPKDPYHKNYVFVGWYEHDNHKVKVEKEKFDKITVDMHVDALYKDDKNNNGIPDDEDTYYNVRFIDSLNKKIIKSEKVLVGLDATAPKAPTHKNYEFTGWDKDYTNVKSNLDVNAMYKSTKTNTDEEEVTMYTVTFVDGDDNKVIESVKVEAGKSATAPTAPKHENRTFDHWDGTYTNVQKDETVTAIYVDDKNHNNIDDDTEPKYTVEFLKGDHGTLNAVNTKFSNVLTGLTFEEAGITIPEIVADKNYKVKSENNGWDKKVETTVTDNATYTAQYFADFNNNDVDDTTELVNLKFMAGDHGKLDDGYTEREITGLLPGYDNYPAAPSVTADQDYDFNGWNPEYSAGTMIPLTNPTLSYTATYFEDKNNNDVDDSTELVDLTFNAGEHGKINNNTTYVVEDLLPGYDNYPAAPSVTADQDYDFNGWDPEYSVGTMIPLTNPTLSYTAKYFEDKNNNDVDDSTELVDLTFSAGEHGNINKEATYVVEDLLPG